MKHLRYFKLYLAIMLFLTIGLANADPPPPQVAVTPSLFEVNIGSGAVSESFRVMNMGKNPMKAKISLAHWELDENNQVKIIPPTEQSLDQWMTINPLSFTVPAGQYQTVRFSVRPRVRPLPGEHRAIIYVEQIPPEDTSDVRMIFKVGVGVYGYVGDVQRIGKLNSVKTDVRKDQVTAIFDISSEGTAHVRLRGQYAIWRAQDFPGADKTQMIEKLGQPEAVLPKNIIEAGVIPALPVLPGNRRNIRVNSEKKLLPGEYMLDVKATLGELTINSAYPFTVK